MPESGLESCTKQAVKSSHNSAASSALGSSSEGLFLYFGLYHFIDILSSLVTELLLDFSFCSTRLTIIANCLQCLEVGLA